METQVYFSHEGESEIQQFHNILHHIDKEYNYIKGSKLASRSFSFYSFIPKETREVSQKQTIRKEFCSRK